LFIILTFYIISFRQSLLPKLVICNCKYYAKLGILAVTAKQKHLLNIIYFIFFYFSIKKRPFLVFINYFCS